MIGCISAKDKIILANIGPNITVSGLEGLSVQVTHTPKWVYCEFPQEKGVRTKKEERVR